MVINNSILVNNEKTSLSYMIQGLQPEKSGPKPVPDLFLGINVHKSGKITFFSFCKRQTWSETT